MSVERVTPAAICSAHGDRAINGIRQPTAADGEERTVPPPCQA